MTGCEIIANGDIGIWLQASGSSGIITGCKIRDNKGYGILVIAGATGEFRNNTLSGNKENWKIYDTAGNVTRIGNTPNE